ncbi:hypothetical protein, partial [Mobiluncus curtisii]|uniref:hypothetical protein n=2 Tax=Mobiluncus curtisii TaxID=2051 RepID=UPI001B8AC193
KSENRKNTNKSTPKKGTKKTRKQKTKRYRDQNQQTHSREVTLAPGNPILEHKNPLAVHSVALPSGPSRCPFDFVSLKRNGYIT